MSPVVNAISGSISSPVVSSLALPISNVARILLIIKNRESCAKCIPGKVSKVVSGLVLPVYDMNLCIFVPGQIRLPKPNSKLYGSVCG